MRFLHISDLHLGLRFKETSMLEDQEHILKEIVRIADNKKPDAILIAGDIYDRSAPSAEAVELFDRFLSRLAERHIQTFVISGNHDSAERIAFGAKLMDLSGIHMSPVYDGSVTPFTLTDSFGSVNVYMLPFVRPVNVKRYYPEESIETYNDAVNCAVSHIDIDSAERNVIIAHQFVTGALTCDSETVSVGGTECISASIFDGFDYVALGHIHGPQSVDGRDTVRYSGTPLKYSFSEENHTKGIVCIDMQEKRNISVEMIPLVPLHDMRTVTGKFEDITKSDFYEGTAVDDYLRIVLTDDEEIPEAMNRLHNVYRNAMELKYDNARTRNSDSAFSDLETENKTPMEFLKELFRIQNGGIEMTAEQENLAAKLFEEIGEEK